MRTKIFPLLFIPIVFLLSGCRTEIINNVQVKEDSNKITLTGQSKLVFDKETSKILINEKNIINDILLYYKNNVSTDVVYKVENDKINLISGIVTDNSDIFSIGSITNNKSNNKSIEINYDKPFKLIEAIVKASETLPDSEIRNSISLSNFFICNVISIEGNITTLNYNKKIWDLEEKYKNEIKLCSNLSTIDTGKMVINFEIKDNSEKIYYLYGFLFLILSLYIIKKIRN